MRLESCSGRPGKPLGPGKVFELDPLSGWGITVLQGVRWGHATVHRRFIALVPCWQVHTLCLLISTQPQDFHSRNCHFKPRTKQNNKFSREICALPKVLLAEWEERNLTSRYLGLWGQTVYSACCFVHMGVLFLLNYILRVFVKC